MNNKISGNLKNIMNQLEISQSIVEQNAYSALIQQDKILALVRDSTDKMIELFSYAEGISFMASELMAQKNKTEENKDNQALFHVIDDFLDFLSQQQVLLQEFSGIYSGVIKYQEEIDSIIHKIENDIANHRNDLDKLTSYNDNTSV